MSNSTQIDMMVTLSEAIASNERIAKTFPDGLVAVFVGGTSGVGEYTLKAFTRYARKPRVYIVGRSQEAADRIIEECKQLNADGSFEFIKSDVSLLKNVDDVCRQIKSKETAINILFESQGSMGFNQKTSEGLPLTSGLIMHGRIRFILNLLPLLQKATSLRRVVSVAAAGFEGAIDLENIPGFGFPLHRWRNQGASVQTLLLEEAARRAPDVSFIHDCPGVVKSGIMRDLEPDWRMSILLTIVRFLSRLIEVPTDQCAEWHVFLATSARFAPRESATALPGVSLEANIAIARGSDGLLGSGVYSTDYKGESSSPKVENVLAGFRKDGTAEKVWEYVKADYLNITGTEVAP